ncbi:MAG: hypothetical protein GY932_08305, partial [Arcobacter sp.]|nr:hypothetical protein [Arcobacter sp.]
VNNLTATILDELSGVETSHSPSVSITIDTTSTDKPINNDPALIDDNGDNILDITNDNTPTVSITLPEDAVAGDKVKLYNEDNEEIGEHELTQEDINNGTVSVTPNEELIDGNHVLTTSITDKAGNESEKSDPIEVEIDTTPTDAPGTITFVDDSGEEVDENGTNDTTPTVIVSLPENTKVGDLVSVYNGEEIIGTKEVTQEDLDKKPSSIEVDLDDTLTDGTHEITATVTDKVGNESDKSEPTDLLIDTVPPGIPTDLVAKDDNGLTVDEDPGTADTTPTVTVSLPEDAEVGDVLKLYNEDNEVIGEHKLTQEDIDNGIASVTPEDELEDKKTHELSVRVTDKTGNESGKSDPIEVKVDSSITPNPDTEAPDAPVISAVENDD